MGNPGVPAVRCNLARLTPARGAGDLGGFTHLRAVHVTDLGGSAATHATTVGVSPGAFTPGESK